MTYTLTTYVKLVWDDFIKFYAIISSNDSLESHAFFNYSKLTLKKNLGILVGG
jgi:uncharacterized CHY-type Zn-finger protein